jgi:hypothetical protein
VILLNSIQAKITTTQCVHDEYLMIFVDEIRFDKWLANALDNNNYINLIPTWLGWLLDSKEQEYVWAKTHLCKSETTIVPILICPDDLDFSCTVVVCEVKYLDTSVQWKRIGIDTTGFPNYIGEDIEWFQNIPLLQFPRKQYETCIDKFIKNQY